MTLRIFGVDRHLNYSQEDQVPDWAKDPDQLQAHAAGYEFVIRSAIANSKKLQRAAARAMGVDPTALDDLLDIPSADPTRLEMIEKLLDHTHIYQGGRVVIEEPDSMRETEKNFGIPAKRSPEKRTVRWADTDQVSSFLGGSQTPLYDSSSDEVDLADSAAAVDVLIREVFEETNPHEVHLMQTMVGLINRLFQAEASLVVDLTSGIAAPSISLSSPPPAHSMGSLPPPPIPLRPTPPHRGTSLPAPGSTLELRSVGSSYPRSSSSDSSLPVLSLQKAPPRTEPYWKPLAPPSREHLVNPPPPLLTGDTAPKPPGQYLLHSRGAPPPPVSAAAPSSLPYSKPSKKAPSRSPATDSPPLLGFGPQNLRPRPDLTASSSSSHSLPTLSSDELRKIRDSEWGQRNIPQDAEIFLTRDGYVCILKDGKLSRYSLRIVNGSAVDLNGPIEPVSMRADNSIVLAPDGTLFEAILDGTEEKIFPSGPSSSHSQPVRYELPIRLLPVAFAEAKGWFLTRVRNHENVLSNGISADWRSRNIVLYTADGAPLFYKQGGNPPLIGLQNQESGHLVISKEGLKETVQLAPIDLSNIPLYLWTDEGNRVFYNPSDQKLHVM